jgi:hypothetical protein
MNTHLKKSAMNIISIITKKEKEFNTSPVKNGNITYEVFFSQIKSHSVENLLHKISLTHIEL